MGEVSSQDIGLTEDDFFDDLINIFVYFMYLAILTIIFMNLFVGISIGEIQAVLENAEMVQLKLKITYILNISRISIFHERLFKLHGKRN